MPLRPLGTKVLVTPQEEETTPSGFVIVQGRHQPPPSRGVVKAIGPKVTRVSVGQEVVFSISLSEINGFRHEGEKYLVIEEEQITGVYNEE